MNNNIKSTQNVIFNKILKLKSNNQYKDAEALIKDIDKLLKNDKMVRGTYCFKEWKNIGRIYRIGGNKEYIQLLYDDLSIKLL